MFSRVANLLSALTKKQPLMELVLFFFAFTLPLSIQANNVSIILLILTWLFSSRQVKIKGSGWIRSFVVFLPVYFALQAISLLYSEHGSAIFSRLETSAAFILLPVSLGIVQSINLPVLYNRFAIGFVMGNVVTCTIFLFKYVSIFGLHHEQITDSAMEKFSHLHASYLSLFLVSAIFMLRHFFKGSNPQKVLVVLVMLLFSATIILSGSKLGAIFLVVALFYVFYQLYRKANKVKLIIMVTLFVGTLLIVGYQNQLVISRFKSILSFNFERHPTKGYNTLSGRFFFWDCSWGIIKDSPFIGVGVGDSQQRLDRCYLAKEPDTVTPEFLGRFNAHNQFLQTTIELGLVGCSLVLFVFFGMIKRSIRFHSKDILVLIFFVLIFCCFESILVRNKGIIFFSTLVCFVYYSANQEKIIQQVDAHFTKG